MNNPRCHSKLWIYFTGVVFAVIAVCFLFITCILFLLFQFGYVSVDPRARHIPILLLAGGSLLIGGAIAIFVGKLIIRPVQNISEAFDELSRGNFDVRVPADGKIEEIREMAEKFNGMAFDLSHIETLRTDFVVSVSHEFKTPLAAISGYATLLQNPNLTPKQHERYVEVILENSRRLSNLSSDILSLSRLENQEIVLHKTEFRLDEQIRKQVLLLEERWTAKKIEFDIEMPKTMYYGNEGLLAQVWSNLLDNAIKASAEGGIIQVLLEQKAHGIFVTITDHGIGMSEEVQKHIFEKFYQADRSRKSEGNGLGLALVKRIMELCGGDISVQSEPQKGTAFRISLPV